MAIDYEYMAITLSNLSGIPVRLYRNEQFQRLYYADKFKPDLAILEEAKIFKDRKAVSYYITEEFLLFGLFRVKSEPISFILGPVTQIQLDRTKARDILRSIGEPLNRDTELLNYLRAIPSYPLRNFLQILCSFSYFINDEKISVADLLSDSVEHTVVNEEYAERQVNDETHNHNTFILEQRMLADVEYGRTDNIRALIQAPTAGRAGKIAHDALRQQKNLLVCNATLVSRAAIKGGMPVEDAFALSDLYIQKSELLNSCDSIMQLSADMVMDFTGKVEHLRSSGVSGMLSRTVRRYVLLHISRNITTEELAQRLTMSRTYFCKRFKEETGVSASRFVLQIRIDEAKRLLRITKKTLGDIALSLGFSSQSHFQNAFKQVVGITPAQYRLASDYSPE